MTDDELTADRYAASVAGDVAFVDEAQLWFVRQPAPGGPWKAMPAGHRLVPDLGDDEIDEIEVSLRLHPRLWVKSVADLPEANGAADELARQIEIWLARNPTLAIADVRAAIDRRFGAA